MHYAFAVCPGFWKWIDDAHSRQSVFSIKQVRDELMALEDELSKWVRPRKSLFCDTNDEATYESQRLLATWTMDNYQPAAQADFLSSADFKLVSYAHSHSHTVVTHEVFSSGFKVKIPNACRAFDVPVISTFEMLKVEGAKFT